ncbi:MAG: hypothetical protein Q9195_005520 [Heterodermia aff. obscurata]
MASIGKAIGALFNVSQETTLALANLSCDFSIIKFEAPKEYAGLATTLSKKRIAEAEDGDIHTTARRLGSLFGQGLPDVPRLMSAYGKRVTEIAALESVNPRGNTSDGPFRDHVGADGTTIWAAATSGTEAIAVHLLACILARMWSPSEAVSIWVEMVDQKKRQLEESFARASTVHSTDIFLSRIQLSRDQLAQWDSSARAWLCTADHAKRIQQTQLRLISDNISFPVSTDPKVYSSVISCWTTAMTAMNDLIEGKPQSVQSGALLLALSAWHLYPDISVQSTLVRFIKQDDPLVDQGGIITVGLQNRTKQSEDGVYWSLPLAHLRVYGKPVVTTRRNGINHTRISFPQFLCVTLGSLFSFWHIPKVDLEDAAEVMCRLAQVDEAFVEGCRQQGHQRRPTPGLALLGRAAQLYLSSKGSPDDEYARLLAYGRRRCKTFLSEDDDRPLQFFGLTNVPIAFSLFNEDTSRTARDRQVDFLRQWTYKRGIDLTGIIICYKGSHDLFLCRSVSGNWTGAKRKCPGANIPLHQVNLHWSALGTESEELFLGLEPTGEGFTAAAEEKTRFLAPGPGENPILHDFMFGDPSVAAVYRPSRIGHQETKIEDSYLRPKELLGLFQDGSIGDGSLQEQIHKSYTTPGPHGFVHSLQALDFAGRIYEHLDDARIDMHVCLRGLHASQYARRLQAEDLPRGTQNQNSSDFAIVSLKLAFSCIILFETGRIDVDPENLEGAMAISHSDSIFVAQKVINDPSDLDMIFPVRRIVGNVGKPGLVILIPPQAPEVRERSLGDWRIVNHAPFDGKYEDNFKSTSLHLAFTGYVLPVDVGERGSLTHEAYLVETVISVYEAGEWVADLDVLKAIPHYKHGWAEHAKTAKKIPLPPLVSIDNWQEILDNPESSAVVRACGNEQARLAVVTVASQLGYQFRIIEPGDHPKYQPGLVQSPSTSESREKAENDSNYVLHSSPEVLLTNGDYDPWDTRVSDGSEPGSQHELDIAGMSRLGQHPSSEDETISCDGSTDAFPLSKGHQPVLYIC